MSQNENTTTHMMSRAWLTRYIDFAVKLVIFTVVVSLGIINIADSIFTSFVEMASTQVKAAGTQIQPMRTKLRAALSDEKTRLQLKGLLTTNPAVHYRVSLIEERKGNLAAAIEDIELALGLLEMHGADRATKEKYTARLQVLTHKVAALPQEANGQPPAKQ